MLLNEKLEKNIKLTTGLVIWLNYICNFVLFNNFSGIFHIKPIKTDIFVGRVGNT